MLNGNKKGKKAKETAAAQKTTKTAKGKKTKAGADLMSETLNGAEATNGPGFSTIAAGMDVQDEMVNGAETDTPVNIGFSLVAPNGEKVNRGVNIGSDKVTGKNYARLIIDGLKTIETRTSKGAIPKSLYHRWMAIVDTSRQDSEQPVIIGYAKFGEPIDLSNPEVFEQYRAETGIEPGDDYDLKDTDKAKWGYPVEDVRKIEPMPLPEGTRANNRNKFFDNVQEEMVNGAGFETVAPGTKDSEKAEPRESFFDGFESDLFEDLIADGMSD